MSNSSSNADERALQQEVLAWYRQQALEVPPQQLDQDILQLAQTHLAEMHQSKITAVESPTSVWRRHPWALSSAASLVLVVGLLVLNRPQIEDVMAPSPMAMSAPAPQAMTRIADTQALQSSNMEAEAVAKHEIQTQMQQAKAAAGALERQHDASSPAIVARSMNAPSASESSDIDKVPLAESLHQLHAFIEAKETEQALVLEQQLLKDYPQLAVEAADKALLSEQQLEFKKLQQQLHQLAK
ncbi:hypothetical protein [Shewanella baltica]|uniref:hypothetical protein n=1 Tax=Shewanella baltica TaxID=62322 RepID=UPI00015310BB|nr:hypothetical protein [Shewanella baltica]ACK47734.1 conserved hypothetical protein [Shewanella baltica OS223]MCS6113604.1 hypothetical protein [Shewanella baltica]UVW63016.1 hypothetical protein HHE93_05270 [Shewanella baltica]